MILYGYIGSAKRITSRGDQTTDPRLVSDFEKWNTLRRIVPTIHNKHITILHMDPCRIVEIGAVIAICELAFGDSN